MYNNKTKPIRILINIIFLACISTLLFTSYKDITEKDISNDKHISMLYDKFYEIALENSINEIANKVIVLNSEIHYKIKENLTSEQFINAYKNNTDVLFEIIDNVSKSLRNNKNNLIVGNSEKIIYSNCVDEYNTKEWDTFLNTDELYDLLSGTKNVMLQKFENGVFETVDINDILPLLNGNNIDELSKYSVLVSTQITNYGDIIGNYDINNKTNNGISQYKMLIIYKKNLANIYRDKFVYTHAQSTQYDRSTVYQYYFLSISIILVIWIIYILTLDKWVEVFTRLKKFKNKNTRDV